MFLERPNLYAAYLSNYCLCVPYKFDLRIACDHVLRQIPLQYVQFKFGTATQSAAVHFKIEDEDGDDDDTTEGGLGQKPAPQSVGL